MVVAMIIIFHENTYTKQSRHHFTLPNCKFHLQRSFIINSLNYVYNSYHVVLRLLIWGKNPIHIIWQTKLTLKRKKKKNSVQSETRYFYSLQQVFSSKLFVKFSTLPLIFKITKNSVKNKIKSFWLLTFL